jgi:hypothetical protein
VEYLK